MANAYAAKKYTFGDNTTVYLGNTYGAYTVTHIWIDSRHGDSISYTFTEDGRVLKGDTNPQTFHRFIGRAAA